MFIKLYRKIYYSIFLICFTLIIAIDALAVTVQITTLHAAYLTTGQARIARIVNSCRLYIRSAETTTENLSTDTALIGELASPTGASLTNKLDDTCNYSLKINAITAYALDGTVYSSSKVSEVPSLDALRGDEEINSFLSGEDEAFLSLRTHTIANIYNNSLYPEKMGVITCCRKVYLEGEVVGYLFTDILPSNLYAYVYGDGQIDDAISFLTTASTYFAYESNREHEDLLQKTTPTGYFKFSCPIEDNGFSIIIFESAKEYALQIVLLCAVLAACTLILTVLLHFWARYTAKSVTNRLDKFLYKMQSENLLV